jgi:mRNA interferase MazF
VRRAEIWTVSGGPDYAGKPRPAVILQDDRFDTDSVTLCPFTTDSTDAPLFRLVVEATPTTGLDTTSRLMVDKITTVRRAKLGERIGELDDADIVRLNRAVVTDSLRVSHIRAKSGFVGGGPYLPSCEPGDARSRAGDSIRLTAYA